MCLANTAVKRKAGEVSEGQQEMWDLKRLAQGHGSCGNELQSLTRNLQRVGRCANIPIDQIPVPYFRQGVQMHSFMSLRAMLRFMLTSGYSKKILGGYDVSTEESQVCLRQFWRKYQRVDPGHPLFGHRPLEDTVPLLIYGDEGTGKRRHPVWTLATKAVLNERAASMHRYFLYTVVPHELYRGYNKGTTQPNECLDAILQHYCLEARGLFDQGPWSNVFFSPQV